MLRSLVSFGRLSRLSRRHICTAAESTPPTPSPFHHRVTTMIDEFLVRLKSFAHVSIDSAKFVQSTKIPRKSAPDQQLICLTNYSSFFDTFRMQIG